MSEGTLSLWLGDINQAKKEEQQKQVLALYLQCLTQEEIAQKLGIDHTTVGRKVQEFSSELLHKPITPESLQLFNVWNFAARIQCPSTGLI